MKHIYEVNIFEGREQVYKIMDTSKKRAKKRANEVTIEGQEAWLRTWKKTNFGTYIIEENEQII